MSEIAPHILTGACRYRDEALKLDRILCVDAPGDYPVKTLTSDGCPINHRANGQSPAGRGFDLIPLPPEPRAAREWDAIIDADGRIYDASNIHGCLERIRIRVREVLPEQEASEAVGSKDSVPSPLPTRVEDTGTESATPESEPVRKFPPLTPAREFSFSAVYSPDSGVTQVALVARSLGELSLMWDSIRGNTLRLDESKVQRVKITGRPTDAAGVPLEGGEG